MFFHLILLYVPSFFTVCLMTWNPNPQAIELEKKCELQYRLYKDSVSLSDYGNYRNEAFSRRHLLTMVVLDFIYSVHPNFQWNALLKEPTTVFLHIQIAPKQKTKWVSTEISSSCQELRQIAINLGKIGLVWAFPVAQFIIAHPIHFWIEETTFYQCFWLYPEFVQTKQINKLVIAWNNKDCK